MIKRVLVAPLDWGLGHATRCIPVIRELQARHYAVYVAGSGPSLELLRTEFPRLAFFTITGYQPRYPSSGSMAWKMAIQVPHFFQTIRREHREVERIVQEQKIDYVISDNRYGCWTNKVPCAFITHQSNILMPKRFGWLSGIVRRMNEQYMKRFSVCWVPDFSDARLSGEMMGFEAMKNTIPVEFIGALSRFRSTNDLLIRYDVTAVFSGPEPQRTRIEEIVTHQLIKSGLRYFIVRGVISEARKTADPNSVNFMKTEELQRLLRESAIVIARSGYSTIMDLAALGKKAILIPTPGQTEQEYLARQLTAKGIAWSTTQKDFDLNTALQKSKEYTGFIQEDADIQLLKDAIDKLIRL